MNGVLLFIALPYLAIFSLIFGSIYRYRFHGFKVSSLSSQLLESERLYFGSRPFHWGIIILFFGHLAGFLFPRSVIAWNGLPVRLYILEITALTFAIISFTGLVILIIRRIRVKRIRVVTTKMDIFVYLILVVQFVTGLWVAIFFRWGSAWFALVLTPYLRSVLTFSPDITAVIALPMMIKVHIIAACVMIGMIPYTRFIHFLVYPFSYLWRAYQKVVWNFDPKTEHPQRG
jgi:nitrate reductase gamma subunit